MTWDGLGFFGFDDSKLGRLKGQPVRFWDKLKNKKWLLSALILFSVVIFVMTTELSKMNTLTLQEITSDYNIRYEYNINE